MSAGYDGRVIIWDIWEGQPVRVYETGDFQIVDGSFSPDGTSLVVSDEVGQFYLLTTGQGQSQKDAKYDQFFLGDFRPLIRDLQGNVLDQETQLPPHRRNIQDLLCDANMIPYQEPYQSMYQQRRLGALGIDWQPLCVNLAVGMDDMNYFAFRDHPLVVHPNIQGSPIETAEDGARRWVEQPIDVDEEMDWEQDVARPSDDSGSDYSVSEESLSLLDDEEEDEGTASSTEHLGHSDEDEDDGEESLQETRLRRSNRNKRKAEGNPSDMPEERKVKKLSSDLQQIETTSNDVRSETEGQRQADVVIPSVRPASHRQITRPKRAAATNALHLFSHIHTNEDGEEEDASSSHQETSSYSDEEEVESDGLPSNEQREDENACLMEEKDKAVEAKRTEEVSQSSGRVVVEEKEGAVFKNEQLEELDSRVNSEGVMIAERAQDDSLRFYQREEIFHEHEKREDVEGILKDAAPVRLDSLEPGDLSKRPRSQRRLILKLRKNETDATGLVNKAELEDPTCDETISQNIDDFELSKDHSKRKLRRLILKGPDSAIQDGYGGSSDTDDSGHCIGLQNKGSHMSDFGKAVLPGDVRRSKKKQKGKSVSKRSKKVHETVATGTSPSSSGHSYDRPTSRGAYTDSLREAAEGVYPDAVVDTSNHDTDMDSGGANWADDTETRQTHFDIVESEVEAVQRILSPDSFARFPPSGRNYSGNNENPSDEEVFEHDKAMTRFRIGSEANRVNAGGRGSYYGIAVEQEQRQDVGKVLNSSKGAGAVRPGKGGKKSVHQYDNSEFLQLSGDGHVRSHVLESPRSVGHLSCARGPFVFEGFETEERDSPRDASNGAVQATLEDMDEVDQHLTGGHIESDSNAEDDVSWTESENVIGQCDVQYLRHKRRTLGEIGSMNLTVQRSEEDSIGKKKVRQMQSVMMEGVKCSRLKGNRGRRAAVKKEKETLDKEFSTRRQGAWTNKVSELNRHEGEDTKANVHMLDDNSTQNNELPYNRSRRRGLWRCEQAGASVLKEKKELRVSSRTKREFTRTFDRDQGRQVEIITNMRDKGVRTRKSLAWLLQSEVEETRYIPQFGDEVVYLRQGHEEYLDMYKLDEPGPWTIYGGALCHSEVCQVVGLEYAILPDSGETCCRFTLEFVGCTSQLQGKTFWLTLPELTNFPDFIVERGRYDASIERKWTNRDRCKVWWRSQSGQGGEWWDGRVVNVKPKSSDFPDSPWERIMVQYKYDLTKHYPHSPWELFDLSDTRWEQPHIDQQTRERLLLVLESAANEPEDAYGLLKLKQASCRSDFLNRLPLPLTLDVIMQRLEKDYYHSTQAFFFDSQLLAANAESYCGPQNPMAQGLQAFVRELQIEIFSDPSF